MEFISITNIWEENRKIFIMENLGEKVQPRNLSVLLRFWEVFYKLLFSYCFRRTSETCRYRKTLQNILIFKEGRQFCNVEKNAKVSIKLFQEKNRRNPRQNQKIN